MFPFNNQPLAWLHQSQVIEISLHSRRQNPAATVKIVENPAAWQGLQALTTGDIRDFSHRESASGESVILDFQTHVVGYLHFQVQLHDPAMHAPVRLRLLFAESLCELYDNPAEFSGLLSRSWIQEEIVNLDSLDGEITLPRRYAFTYLRIEVIDSCSPIRFTSLFVQSVSSADDQDVVPYNTTDEILQAIDRVSVNTLADCMQKVFEDGPKRDRRLWLGDLRLQALTNSVSFRNWALVERSLYLLAARTDAEGTIPACVYDTRIPIAGNRIVDYALLLGDVLLHHGLSYDRWEIARELFPLALQQLGLVRKHLDANGIFRDPGNCWLFIDWQPELNREMAIQGVYIYALRRNAELAEYLNQPEIALQLHCEADCQTRAVRTQITPEGVILSGPERQLSYATQIWMILARVFSAAEGADALATVRRTPDSVKPVTPYLWHHYVEACFLVGEQAEAMSTIKSYWGQMIEYGAHTFWEVFVPDNPDFSPYSDRRLNSACHAWSCTPSYFLRCQRTFFSSGDKLPDTVVAAPQAVY